MDVKLIAQSGAASLIEYVETDGSLRRVWIPKSVLAGGLATLEELRQGIQYGLPWEELGVTPSVAHELRRRGIWTADDLRRHPNIGVAALQAAYSASVQRLLAAALNYELEAQHGRAI